MKEQLIHDIVYERQLVLYLYVFIYIFVLRLKVEL